MTTATEPRASAGIRFGLHELDLLGTFAGKRFPFPLRVPSSGRAGDEREALLAAAGRTLSERGLATTAGPAGIAADLVGALRGHRAAVDVVVVGDSTVTGAVAMVHRHRALVCSQRISGAPGPVTVSRVAAAALADELAARIPRAKAALAIPIALPPGVTEDAVRLFEDTAGAGNPRGRVRTLVAERGGDEAVVDALLDLVPSVTGRGQLGIVLRPRAGKTERPLELSWIDSPNGRLRVDRDDRGWVSVNPLRHGELVRVLREAATLARQSSS